MAYAEKVHQAGGEILELMYKAPLRHHGEIISKCKDVDKLIKDKDDNPTIEEIESEIK